MHIAYHPDSAGSAGAATARLRQLENPFSPRSPVPPERFVGRQRETDIIFEHISGAHRGNVAVSGNLGLGKTSLLLYTSDRETASAVGVSDSIYLRYIDAQSIVPFSTARFWRRALAPVLTEVGAPLSAGLSSPNGQVDTAELEDLLDALAYQRRGLVLFVDEFEWLIRADTDEDREVTQVFLAQMASLGRRVPRSLSLVIATQRSLSELVDRLVGWRGSPFSTIFTSVTLKPFTREEASELLERALAGSSLTFDESDRQFLFRLSLGHPAALQNGAFGLFLAKQRGAEPQAAYDQVRDAVSRSQLELLPHTLGAPRESGPSPVGLWVEPVTGDVYVEGRRSDPLTPLEYNLLLLLYENSERMCTREEIIERVWGGAVPPTDNTRVEKLISRLRRKVEPYPDRPTYVRTVRGKGYRLLGRST
jgi:hypothetical protein